MLNSIRSPLDGIRSPFGPRRGPSFVGPLDTLSSAAAFSVRLLRAAYTGPCMRVRRSSDNAETNIGFTAAGELDTAALLAHCGAGNGFVTTWYDQSGNASDATQATAANQLRIVDAGVVESLNGRPAHRFIAPHSRMLFYITRDADWYAHGVISPSASNQAMFQLGDANEAGAIFVESNSWKARSPIIGDATLPFVANENVVISARFRSIADSNDIWKNGVRGTSGGRASVAITNLASLIGALRVTPTYPLNGPLAELIIGNGILSDVDRQTLETNQMQFYGITP